MKSFNRLKFRTPGPNLIFVETFNLKKKLFKLVWQNSWFEISYGLRKDIANI